MIETLQTILIYGGSFVAVLSLVVFVHEFGHFQAARWCKVAIDTFSIGFGKPLASWRDRQGVEWKIGSLPLGGYVKFADDADAMSSAPKEQITDPAALAEARRKGLFHAQPIPARAFVVAAGPITNFIFAIAAFAAILMIMGRDVTDRMALPARVDGVLENSAAAAAGLRPGDVIVAVDGQAVGSFGGLQEHISARAGERLVVTVSRGGDRVDLAVTPDAREVQTPEGVRTIGVLGIERRTLPEERRIERVSFVEAIQTGAEQTWMIVAMTGAYVADVVTGKQSGDQISGPIGIMNQSGQIASMALEQQHEPLLTKIGELLVALVHWAAILSVAVGIVNLLPIPILDGGHLLFYAIEAIRGGKPLPLMAQEWAFRAGIAVMGALFLFATWNDIQRHLNLG